MFKGIDKISHIILILLFFLTINSCAEIDRPLESANSSLAQQILPSAYDILVGTEQMSSQNLFFHQQNLIEKGSSNSTKNNNIFIVKQNTLGNREWIMDLGISDEESGISMTFDSFENVYMTEYSSSDLKGNKEKKHFTVFLVKYNSYGSKEWIKMLGKSEVEEGVRLAVDSFDNIYVTGFYRGLESEKDIRLWNTLLAKYDTSGNMEWEKNLGPTLNDFSWDITFDSLANICVIGLTENSFAQNTSWHDEIILMRFNTAGKKL